VLAQNMEGASTVRAAGFIYKIAPKDGTSIAAISPGAVVGPLLEGKLNGLYDPTKFHYLATANNSTRVCAVFHTSKIKTFKDAYTQEAIISASAEGGSTRDYAYLHKKTSHVNFRIISGYHGTPSAMLAMERGEVHGRCGGLVSSIRSTRPEWFPKNMITVPIQIALERSKIFPDVPAVIEFAQEEKIRSILELVLSPQAMDRPIVGPGGLPPARLAMLRKAFHEGMNDPGFIAEAGKQNLEIDEVSGERLAQIVSRAYSMPPEIVRIAHESMNLTGSQTD
jgi:tripartite-type tricarboxylate transporter receptor subunit TctC